MGIKIPESAHKAFINYAHNVVDAGLLSNGYGNEGKYSRLLEEEVFKRTGLHAATISNGGTAIVAALEFVGVRGKYVFTHVNVPTAVPQAIIAAGGIPIFIDCNKDDLSTNLSSLLQVIDNYDHSSIGALLHVHIGGHPGFETEEIATLCRIRNIPMIEDCAQSFMSSIDGLPTGSFGIIGTVSLFATKVITAGEGGLVVSTNRGIIDWIKRFRDYDHSFHRIRSSMNYRMSELQCAFGLAVLQSYDEISIFKAELALKLDQIFKDRLVLPKGVVSNYYKYVVYSTRFNYGLESSKVYDTPVTKYSRHSTAIEFPEAREVSRLHHCIPIHYGCDLHDKSVDEIAKILV